MLQNTCDNKSTLGQVMPWCRQASSHYLNQWWPRFPSRGKMMHAWIWCIFKFSTIYVSDDQLYRDNCISRNTQTYLVHTNIHIYRYNLHLKKFHHVRTDVLDHCLLASGTAHKTQSEHICFFLNIKAGVHLPCATTPGWKDMGRKSCGVSPHLVSS